MAVTPQQSGILADKVVAVRTANPSYTQQQVADAINAETVERNRASMTANEIFENIELTVWQGWQESATPADNQKFERVNTVLCMGEVNPFGKVASVFTQAFGAGSTTILALAAARKETISWAIDNGLPDPIRLGWVMEVWQ